jgi:hypothetical protein
VVVGVRLVCCRETEGLLWPRGLYPESLVGGVQNRAVVAPTLCAAGGSSLAWAVPVHIAAHRDHGFHRIMNADSTGT